MTQEELFATAIGIQSPWYIEDIQLDIPKGELNIKVNFKRGSKFLYLDEQTGKSGKYKAYDTQEKKWRHMNFFQYRCYLQAKIPRIKLEDGKIRQVKATWEGLSHGFTLLFEALILQFAKVMPAHQICKMAGTYDYKVWDILKHYTAKQKEKYQNISMSKLNIKTFRNLRIREEFQQINLRDNKKSFETLLKKWYYWATHSKIPQIIKVAKTIKNHWNGVVNWANSRITNVILEGYNSIFQAAKAKGYKKTSAIQTIIYLLTAKLDFSLVNPSYITHSLLLRGLRHNNI